MFSDISTRKDVTVDRASVREFHICLFACLLEFCATQVHLNVSVSRDYEVFMGLLQLLLSIYAAPVRKQTN